MKFLDNLLTIAVISVTISLILSVVPTEANGTTPKKVAIESHSWLASIQWNHTLRCSGTIISPNVVLTTVSCLIGYSLSGFTVRVGSNRVSSEGQSHIVVSVKTHELYNSSTESNDLALLKVSPNFDFSRAVNYIWLASEKDPIRLEYGDAYVAGWKWQDHPDVLELRQAKLRLINCEPDIDSKLNICASPLTPNDQTGLRHFGGPLVDSNRLVVGIMRPSSIIITYQNPGVFLKIAPYRSWILHNSGRISEL